MEDDSDLVLLSRLRELARLHMEACEDVSLLDLVCKILMVG